MGCGCGTGRALLSLSLSSSASTRLSFSLLLPAKRIPLSKFKSLQPPKLIPGFRPFCSTAVASPEEAVQPIKHTILLERLRTRHLKDSSNAPQGKSPLPSKLSAAAAVDDGSKRNKKKSGGEAVKESFEELGLTEEVIGALEEMGISVPTEIQSIGIPAVLEGKSVVLGSHTGSGKTLAYMLPLAQLLKRDEALYGMLMKPRRPRAVVLCPTRELSEQVFRVAKAVSHHARFRSTMVSGGTRIRPQEDSLNTPIDMVVGTPGRVLQHIEEGNIVYGDIKYLVLDEADTMFDRGFGPDLRKFLGPLKNRASKTEDGGFQTVLVTATMTKAVQTLVEEEFQGILHVRTSTLHKRIANARHDFINLSGGENKMEALLQVLEPSLSKGNRVMVFCNTLNSSRAVDHFLTENQISTVNYHGEVPAEERVENLKKFKSDSGDCPTLVCTDLAARGLDLDVDHVIMFDFPANSIDYLHRTGRTARMGAKGKVTSLVAKRDQALANRIEAAIMKNESLESLTVDNARRDIARTQITEQKNSKSVKILSHKRELRAASAAEKSIDSRGRALPVRNSSGSRAGRASAPARSGKMSIKPFKSARSSGASSSNRPYSGDKKPVRSSGSSFKKSSSSETRPVKSPGSSGPKKTISGVKRTSSRRDSGSAKATTSKLSVVGFRGRSSVSERRN